MRSSLALAAALLCVLAACHRNVEPYLEGEEASQPDLARIFPDAGEAPASARGRAPMGADATSAPGLPPASPRAAAQAGGEGIRGRVEIAPDLVEGAPRAATLFLIARRAGAAAGPPLAVRRIVSPSLPLDFDIGPQHAMIAGVPFSGEILLTARLDGDGDAMTRLPGDLSGSATDAVEPGATEVRIVLDQRI